MGEGQHDVPDAALDELNRLDRVAEQAVEAGDQPAFTVALAELLAAVRTAGDPLGNEVLVGSGLVLPPPDATIDEVRHLFDGDAEGLIPG